MPLMPLRRDIVKRYHKNSISHKDYRTAAIKYLGSRCVKCKYDDSRALVLDHIKGDGCIERQKVKSKDIYRAIFLAHHFLVQPALEIINERYQLLCSNCNLIKQIEYNERGNNLLLQASNIGCFEEVAELFNHLKPYCDYIPDRGDNDNLL